MENLAGRVKHRIQLTTDGPAAYLEGVEEAFGNDVDYAMLVKLYGSNPESAETRYSPAKCIGTHLNIIEGFPDKKHISTSYGERQNLTMRMGVRRFTWADHPWSMNERDSLPSHKLRNGVRTTVPHTIQGSQGV